MDDLTEIQHRVFDFVRDKLVAAVHPRRAKSLPNLAGAANARLSATLKRSSVRVGWYPSQEKQGLFV
jgi:hypothetical protein